ncbi:hypothetical protein [Ornithinimicrobium faecis]|uniref:hypothetical protein n=1 Tax=Ornithinimicrobium faecis TaxID=2934158 RepID=UPI002118C766|nr:hypothetical protein [Ornithinimicrobium sp. HY1745]
MSSLPARVTRRVGRLRDQFEESVQQRVATVRAREQSHTTQADSGNLAFGHGYLVRAPGVPRPPEVAGWRTRTISGFVYHARARITASPVSTGGAVVLVGRAVDVDTGNVSPQRLTDELSELAAQSTQALIRRAAYLGGSWTLFRHSPDGSCTVLTDALASQRVWHSPDARTIGSYAALVPDSTALPTNSLLHVTGTGEVTVRRFYPWPDTDPPGQGAPTTDLAAAYAEFRKRVVAHTRLLSDLGRPGLPLTTAPASRAVLAAYLPHRRDGGYTFTSFATESARKGQDQANELFEASRVSHELGIAHRVVRAVVPPWGDSFSVAYRRTFPQGTSLASAFARHTLPRDTVELHAAGADVVDLRSWEQLGQDYLEGDLAHRVLLPFNDRRLLEIMLSLPAEQRTKGLLVNRLAAELDVA